MIWQWSDESIKCSDSFEVSRKPIEDCLKSLTELILAIFLHFSAEFFTFSYPAIKRSINKTMKIRFILDDFLWIRLLYIVKNRSFQTVFKESCWANRIKNLRKWIMLIFIDCKEEPNVGDDPSVIGTGWIGVCCLEKTLFPP